MEDEFLEVVGDEPEVRAAGVVPFRVAGDGIELLVIHRNRYDDWSFPKGKREADETDEACAVRELREETGISAELGAELPTALYADHKGRSKEVRYWLMRLLGSEADAFAPNDEVDRLVWLGVDAARARLTYPIDRGLVDEALLVLASEEAGR